MFLDRTDLTGLSNRLDTHLVVLLNPSVGNASEDNRSDTTDVEVVVDRDGSDSAVFRLKVRLCCCTL